MFKICKTCGKEFKAYPSEIKRGREIYCSRDCQYNQRDLFYEQGLRRCNYCKEIKKLSEFGKDKFRKYGYRLRCRKCEKKIFKKYYYKDIEKTRLKQKIYSKKRGKYPRVRFHDYKHSAEQRNILFKLTFEEFMTFWQKSCYYCNSKIETIGIDRIENIKGYVIGNLIPCCSICNYTKRGMSQNEFYNHCKKIIDNWDGS